jgi:multiple sugar transport system permease protein
MAAKPERGIWLRKLVLTVWGLICFLPILFFATIALRPRNEIIAPEPIYFPTLTIRDLGQNHGRMAPHDLFQEFRDGDHRQRFYLPVCSAFPRLMHWPVTNSEGREDIGFYILSTKMMAPAAVAIPIFVCSENCTLLDTVWALMLVYAAMNLSIVVWIIRSYMLDIPSEIEDAARTDGASDLRIMWSIVIPMCLPGIVTGLRSSPPSLP